MKRALWALAVIVPVLAVVAWIGWFSPWFSLDTVEVRIASASAAAGPLTSQEVEAVVARVRPGDVVMTMGAGDVGLLAPQIVELLRERT